MGKLFCEQQFRHIHPTVVNVFACLLGNSTNQNGRKKSGYTLRTQTPPPKQCTIGRNCTRTVRQDSGVIPPITFHKFCLSIQSRVSRVPTVSAISERMSATSQLLSVMSGHVHVMSRLLSVISQQVFVMFQLVFVILNSCLSFTYLCVFVPTIV